MAASITKLVPLSLRAVLRPVRAQRLVCTCRDRLATNYNVEETKTARTFSRCLSTSTKYWNKNTETTHTDSEPVKTEELSVTEEGEPDVLYKKLLVEVKGHDKAVLKSYTKFIQLTSKYLGLKLVKIHNPPKHIFRQSVLKSVHIYKKHQAQYEERTHYQVYEFTKMTGSTADTFLEYIQRNLPEGVAMKVTKHRLEQFPDHIQPPTNHTAQIEHSKS